MIMKPEWSLLTILIPTIADGMRHLHWEICHIPHYGGAELLIGAEPNPEPLTIGTAVDETMTEGMLYFEKILDLCDRRGIQVVCTNLPYSGFEEKIGATNYAKQILKERNTPASTFSLMWT